MVFEGVLAGLACIVWLRVGMQRLRERILPRLFRDHNAEPLDLSSRGRVAPLDGLRALALVAVVGYHAAPTTLRGGFLGVDVFFVSPGSCLRASWWRSTGAQAGLMSPPTRCGG